MNWKRIIVLSLVALLLCTTSIPVSAASTAERLAEVRQEKKKTDEKRKAAKEKANNLDKDKVGLQMYLQNLTEMMEEATAESSRIEKLIRDMEEEILQAERDLKTAQIEEKEQYTAMKKRIQFMYEKGNSSYLEMLFSAESFSSFLHMSEYVEKLTAYDRKMLKSYQGLCETIEADRLELVQQKDDLEEVREIEEENKIEIAQLIEDTKKSIENFKEQISEEEERALAYEKILKEQEASEEQLQKKLDEERALAALAAQSAVRDLSDITFDGGDIDLLAAIIECEAGGESYTGKVAVGAVVMNRVKSSVFPETMAGVIYQNKQFSPVASGRFAVVLARGANESCYQAAQEAMSGASPVGNCLFFRTPIPGLTGIQIGGHIFY